MVSWSDDQIAPYKRLINLISTSSVTYQPPLRLGSVVVALIDLGIATREDRLQLALLTECKRQSKAVDYVECVQPLSMYSVHVHVVGGVIGCQVSDSSRVAAVY